MDLPGVENPALAAGHHQGQPQCMALLDRSVTRTSPGTALPQDILSRFKSATTARSRRLLPYVLQDSHYDISHYRTAIGPAGLPNRCHFLHPEVST
eukprot:1155388-Pelagomonas_calceolata.AAC.1